MSEATKVCTKCGETKALTEYHKDSKGKYGHSCKCKQCVSAYKKAVLLANPEKIRAQKNASYARHKDTKRRYDAVYYLANKERISARASEYKKRNREHCNKLSNLERQRKRETLHDDYIKQLLNGKREFKHKLHEVPKALLEAKRLQILIRRRIKDEDSNRTT